MTWPPATSTCSPRMKHEMGHVLGLGDQYDLASRNDLMYGYLTFGDALPATGEADGIGPGQPDGH